MNLSDCCGQSDAFITECYPAMVEASHVISVNKFDWK
jgi:hypothetical protein